MFNARNVSLLFFVSLIAFSAAADTGIAALSGAFERLLIIGLWSVSSVTLLVVALTKYARTKKTAFAVLVYTASASILGLYALMLYIFLDIDGSLLSDETVDMAYREPAIANFRILIVFGCILLLALLGFVLYHVRSARRKQR